MARRARIVGPAESPAEEEGRNQDQGESTETAESESVETASSAFSVVDRRGDDYVPPNDSAIGSIEIIEGEPKRRTRQTRARIPKATANEIAQAAPLIVGLSNQVVVSWLGPECAMMQTEANFLTPSVARMLARLPAGAAQQVSYYTDPFIVLVALGLWASRIARIKDAQAKAQYQTTPFEAARSYGASGTNLGEDVPPINQTDLPDADIRIDPDRANGAASTIMQGRNPI